MKIYTSDKEYIAYLKDKLPSGVTLVSDKSTANYLVSGRFKAEDYHDELKGIIIPFTGHNGIDLPALKKYNLTLFNTTVHSIYVAEKALKLTLGILGNIQIYHPRMQRKDWSNRNGVDRISWESLLNKRVGVYGYGRIGKHLKSMLSPFTKYVYTIDRGKDYGDALKVASLEALVETCDVIIIAAPLNTSTKNAFDAKILTSMKDKFLINVGRGHIVNQKALYDSLKNNILKGYASDVWYNYPKNDEAIAPSDYPIHTLDNVLMTPHVGGFSNEAPLKLKEKVLDHIKNIANGDFSEALDPSILK